MVLLNTALLHQVRWIRRGAGALPQQRIRQVGGGCISGPWLITIEQAIQGIEEGTWLFCVLQDERVVPVVIAMASSGEKYLKTAVDDEQPELLLTLHECPRSSGSPPAGGDYEPPPA